MSNQTISNTDIIRILNLLNEGEDKIVLGDYKKATIILGNTGSGKTTFTKFISGNNENLFSQEVSEDSGEYLIIDDENKISVNSTVISKTTFPELMVDEKTKNAYIDNPGFNDGRNEAYDIAASYFIKKVLQKAKNVKLILVTNYASLRKGVLRSDFIQLLQHFTMLVKNLDKYVDGIALVATKVDNSYIIKDDRMVLVKDDKVLNNIAQFLEEVQSNFKDMMEKGSEYISNVRHEKDKKFYQNVITLLNIILTKKNGQYERLAIFRRPNKAGKLSDIPAMQENKKNIKTMLERNLRYVNLDETDIGYTISDKSKNIIHDMVAELNKEIKSLMSAIGSNLIDFYKSEEQRLYKSDMYLLLENLNLGLKTLTALKTTQYSSNAKQLAKDMFNSFQNAKVFVPISLLRKIFKLGKFLTFLEDVSSKKFDSETWKWVDELNNAYSTLENSILWYDLLKRIYSRLGEYELQTKFDNQVIPDFEKVFHAEDETMLLENISSFMNFIEQFNDNPDWLKSTNYPQLRKIRVDKIKLRYLDAIIESTLKQSVDQICSKNNFTIVGEFIRLSQIINHSCYPGSSLVQIFAKNTIFLDTDMVGEKDVAILAQRWHVIGDRLINLDGAKGDNHYFSKAQSGSEPGSAGHDGLPGVPGHSAGNFFGIGQILENIKRLKITAIGGAGGQGQNGGDGADGKDGTEFVLYNPYYLICEEGKYCQISIHLRKSALFYLNVQTEINYHFRGTKGGNGGDAGRGGEGGVAGKSGTVEFLNLSKNTTFPAIKVGTGGNGRSGRKGLPGNGGRDGNDYGYTVEYGTWSDQSGYGNSRLNYGRGSPGNAVFEKNAIDLQQPVKKIIQHSPSQLISDYRNFLLKNLKNCVTQGSTREFYLHLLNEDNLKSLDGNQALSNELLEVEKNYHDFQPDVNIFLYNSLLNRIPLLASNSSNDSFSLKLLLATIRCNQIRLESAPESHLIPISSYIDLFARFQEHGMDLYHDKMATKKLKEIDEFLHSNLAIQVDDFLSFENNRLSKLLQNDEEMANILLEQKASSVFAKIGDLLTFISYLIKSELEVISNTNVGDIIFHEKDHITTFVRPQNVIIESEIFGRLRELQFNNQLTLKRETLSILLAEERRLIDAENIYYEQSELLRDAERKLKLSKYENSDKKMIAVNYSLQVHQKVFTSITQKTIEKKILDALIQIDAKFKLIELIPELYERLNNSEENFIVKVVDVLTSYKKQFTTLDNSIEEIVNIFEQVANSMATNYSTESSTFGIINDSNVLIDLLERIKMLSHSLDINLEMYDDLIYIVESTDYACNVLMKILASLPSYKDRKMLNAYARYIENHQPIPSLKLLVQNNLMFFEYEKLLQAFQNYVFPLDAINFASHDLPETPAYNENLSALRSSLTAKVDDLKKKIITLESSTNENVLEGDFSRDTTLGPFFTWKNSLHTKSLSRLLRGEKITLTATVPESSTVNMIKFSSIRPRFNLPVDHVIQKLKLEEAMKNFQMTITHSGISYFSFCQRVHQFEGDSSTFTYNFNNTEFAAVENKYIFSPFTMWHFQLTPYNANSTMFASLDQFREYELDLQLEGHARYISTEDEKVCLQFEKTDHTANILETDEKTDRTPDEIENTSEQPIKRKRRQIEDQEDQVIMSENSNGIFETLKKPLRSFLNYWNSPQQYSTHSEPKHLSSRSDYHSPQSSTPISFNFNATITLADFFVRCFTKIKPYSTEENLPNLSDIRYKTICILDTFESVLNDLSDRYQIPVDYVQPDPIPLMLNLEKELLNGQGNAFNLINILLQSLPLTDLSPSVVEDFQKDLELILKEEFLVGSQIQSTSVWSDNITSNYTDYNNFMAWNSNKNISIGDGGVNGLIE